MKKGTNTKMLLPIYFHILLLKYTERRGTKRMWYGLNDELLAV